MSERTRAPLLLPDGSQRGGEAANPQNTRQRRAAYFIRRKNSEEELEREGLSAVGSPALSRETLRRQDMVGGEKSEAPRRYACWKKGKS